MGTCSLTPQHALFHPHRYPCAVSNPHSCPRVLIRSHCLSLSAVTYGCHFLPGPVRGTGVTEMKTCSSCPRGGTLFLPSQSSSSERSGNLLSNYFALATEGPETYLPSVSSGVKHTSGNIRGQDLCQRQGPRLRTQFLWGGGQRKFQEEPLEPDVAGGWERAGGQWWQRSSPSAGRGSRELRSGGTELEDAAGARDEAGEGGWVREAPRDCVAPWEAGKLILPSLCLQSLPWMTWT